MVWFPDDRGRVQKYVGYSIVYMNVQGIGFDNINYIKIQVMNKVKNHRWYLYWIN